MRFVGLHAICFIVHPTKTLPADGVAISNGNDFGWPRKTSGRYGEQEEEKGEAGTTHTGIP